MVTVSARLEQVSDCSCKLQTNPLVREGAPQKQDRNFQTATLPQELQFVVDGVTLHNKLQDHRQ
jgi:hypothetical protein